MKHLTFLLVIILFGCQSKIKEHDIIGSWDCISVLDVETDKLSLLPSGEKLIAEFKYDSLYLIENNEDKADYIFAWQIKGDSLILVGETTCYIKELNNKSLIVDVNLYGGIERFAFKKIE